MLKKIFLIILSSTILLTLSTTSLAFNKNIDELQTPNLEVLLDSQEYILYYNESKDISFMLPNNTNHDIYRASSLEFGQQRGTVTINLYSRGNYRYRVSISGTADNNWWFTYNSVSIKPTGFNGWTTSSITYDDQPNSISDYIDFNYYGDVTDLDVSVKGNFTVKSDGFLEAVYTFHLFNSLSF